MLAGTAICGIDLREEEYLPPDQFAPAGNSKFFDPTGRLVHKKFHHRDTEITEKNSVSNAPLTVSK
jgi:hypothetical protein